MTTRFPDDFGRIAREQGRGSFLGDVWAFVRQTGKWWLLPVLFLLLLFGLLLLTSGSAAAPFIYTLF